MTIRFPASLGIEMKKRSFLLVLLAALLLFTACEKRARFTVSEDGYRFTDRRTGVTYTALSPAFEPAKGGNARGKCKLPDGTERTLREIPSLSPDLWLADDEKTLYYAGEGTPDPAAWEMTAVLFCEDEGVSIERYRWEAPTAGEKIAALCTTWWNGEERELPPGAPTLYRALKFQGAEYPNIYYCIGYYQYEDGSAVLYEKFSGRCVSVPAETYFGVK